jgi:hypothetical protein
MWLFLATEVFGALFLTWIYSRHWNQAGFDAGAQQTELAIGTINTVILLVSSFVYSAGASDVSKQPGPKRPNQQGCKSSCQDQSQRHRCPSVRSILSQTNRDPNRSRRRGAGHPIIRFVAGAESPNPIR